MIFNFLKGVTNPLEPKTHKVFCPYIEVIANYLIDYTKHFNIQTNLWRLMQLLYLVNGWEVVIRGRRLFPDEFLVHKKGIFITSIYHTFKSFGHLPIQGTACIYDMESLMPTVPSLSKEDKEDMKVIELLDTAIHVYCPELSDTIKALVCGRGSPWQVTRDKYGDGAVIPDSLSFKYYHEQFGPTDIKMRQAMVKELNYDS